MVRKRTAKETLPGCAWSGLLAAALLPGRAAKLLAASTRAASLRLEFPRAAEESLSYGDTPFHMLAPPRSVERGSLVGLSPEALCGEALKGQPAIHRETSWQAMGRPRNIIR